MKENLSDFLKNAAGKIWRRTPRFLRQKIVRVTQDKFTISVGGVIFNEKNEVLLLDHVLRPASGWGIPGGFMSAGEQPAETLRREIFEESGLQIERLEMIRVRTHHRHLEILFRARAGGEPQVKSREILAARWFAPDHVPDAMGEAQKYLIKQVLAREDAGS